jgi:hypothetical protein
MCFLTTRVVECSIATPRTSYPLPTISLGIDYVFSFESVYWFHILIVPQLFTTNNENLLARGTTEYQPQGVPYSYEQG